MKRIYTNIFLWACLILPEVGNCLSPMIQYHDLVAGNGVSGFKDGAFCAAEFNQPIGLALNVDESALYVADENNNLIRAVMLKEKNEVVTLAGSVTAGRVDGPLSIASFNQPKDLASLPRHRVAVYEAGNHLIRLIDLNRELVSTLAGGATTGLVEGDGLKVQLGAVWNLVFNEKDNCLYFSIPDAGLVQKLEVESGRISTVMKGSPLVPHPQALLVADGKLFVADRVSPVVYEISKSNPKQVGLAQTAILGLAGSGKKLYAYQTNPAFPIYRLFPNAGPVTYPSAFGYMLTQEKSNDFENNPGQLIPLFQSAVTMGQVGFVYSPRAVDRFYVTNPSQSFVGAVRDYTTCIEPNEPITIADHTEIVPFSDPDCRYTKPEGTYRIFMTARSFMDIAVDDRRYSQPALAQPEVEGGLKGLPKRVEVELNTLGALDDYPVNFQVLRKPLRGYDFLFSSYWVVPSICEKYDLDMVLLLRDDMSLGFVFGDMLSRPVDSDGCPEAKADMEFSLKTIKDRFPSGPYHDFLQYALAHKMVNCFNDKYWVVDGGAFLNNPEARARAIQILGQPLKMMKKKMDGMRTKSGKPPQLVMAYFPVTNDFFTNEQARAFWRDLCQEEGITFLDLCDDFATVGMSYGFNHSTRLVHFTESGLDLFARLLSHELIRHQVLPTKSVGP